jgi:predicted ATPase
LLHLGPKVSSQLEAELQFALGSGTAQYLMRLVHAAVDTLVFADETLGFPENGDSRAQVIALGAGHVESRVRDRATAGDMLGGQVGHLLNQCRVYHFHDTSPTARVRQACYINDNRWLVSDAANLAAVLHAYRNQNEAAYHRIVSTMRNIMLDFDDFDLMPSGDNANDIVLNWRKRGSDYLFGPHQISDGTLRAMALVTLFLQPEQDLPNVIIIDEPELGLHPHALGIIAGLMRAASLKSQVIVATQSLTFLNHFEPTEIITVESHQGASRFRRLEMDELSDWLEDYSIGELWERNVIGAGPLP